MHLLSMERNRKGILFHTESCSALICYDIKEGEQNMIFLWLKTLKFVGTTCKGALSAYKTYIKDDHILTHKKKLPMI